jgi:hypothetical protein
VARQPTHFSQWAAQFAVASELCKRNYEVALTLGNHPKVDLMVFSTKGVPFAVDVKGLRAGSTWLVRRKAPVRDLYYVLAFVPPGNPNQYFVMNQETANRLIRGDTSASDIRRADILNYLDKWEALPP